MLAFITREQLDIIRAGDPSFNYDGALPQGLYEDITKLTGLNPCGKIVFVYQNSLVGGYAQAVSNDGARMLADYIAARASPNA